jgi:copper chaperone CopZ
VALDTAKYGPMIESAFSLPKDEISALGRLADGEYFVVQATQITPKRERAFEEVQGHIRADWMEEETRKAIKAYATEITKALENVASEEEVKTILAKHNVTTYDTVRAKRAGVTSKEVLGVAVNAIKDDFVQHLFQQNQPMHPLAPSGYVDNAVLGGVYLRTLNPSEAAANEQYGEIVKRLSGLYEQEIAQQYLMALQQRFSVTRNPEVMKRVTEQF